MKGQDKNPDVRVHDEPEEERPVGAGEDDKSVSNGLAADPYAEDIPFRLARAGVPRWVWIGVAVLILVVLLVVLIVIRARG